LKNGASGRDPALRGTFVDAHILASMLRSPKCRAPWLTARHVLFSTLLSLDLDQFTMFRECMEAGGNPKQYPNTKHKKRNT
jgi:hypothetical protein